MDTDNGLYFPAAAADYYGYNHTGVEAPAKWDDHHSFFGVDGQNLHYSVAQGAQTEGSPYVYYPSDYGYAPPSYSPYSLDPSFAPNGSFVATQEYLTNPAHLTYNPAVPSPYYVPLVLTSAADTVPVNTMDPLLYGNVPFIRSIPASEAVKTTNSVVSPVIPFTSTMPFVSNPAVASLKQFQDPVKLSKVPLYNPSAVISPVEYATKANMSVNNGFAFAGSDLRKLVNAEKFQPSLKSRNLTNSANGRPHVLSEQNLGTGAHRLRGQRASAITVKAYTSKLNFDNSQGFITISADNYNKRDFRVEFSYAKFFVIKSYSEDDVHKSIKYGVWSSTPNGNKKLNVAYEDAKRLSAKNSIDCPVFLFFSVNGSGHFCGVAEMVGPVDFQKDMDFWHQDKWSGSFPVKWHIIKDVSNSTLRQILLENNENRPVTFSRDTQEIPYIPGKFMLKIFKDSTVKDSILNDFMKFEQIEENSVKRRSKLSYNAPVYVPKYVLKSNQKVAGGQQLKEDKIQADSILNQSGDAAEKHQGDNFNVSLCSNEQQGSCKILSSEVNKKLEPESHLVEHPSSETEMKKDGYSVSQQQKDHAKPLISASNIEKDYGNSALGVTNHPPVSNGKFNSEMKQPNEKVVGGYALKDGKQNGAVGEPPKVPKKNPNGTIHQTMMGAGGSSVPPSDSVSLAKNTESNSSGSKLDQNRDITRKIGSLAIGSQIKEDANCSSCSNVVTIGTMPIKVPSPDEQS